MDAAHGNGGAPTHLCRSIVTLTIGLSAVACLGIGTAYPHDPKRPELNAWFKSLKNKAGKPCCDSGDGQHAEAEWDMAKGGYKVLLKDPQRPNEPGQWFDVPYSAVINRPKRHRDGLVVADLRRWNNDPDVALLHSGSGGIILTVMPEQRFGSATLVRHSMDCFVASAFAR
jgi:hypothetical protein